MTHMKHMKHTDVLKKKEARLLKYTGRKLVLKRRALNKALERAGLAPAVVAAPKAAPKTVKTVETADPEWLVQPPEGAPFKVRAPNEKKARSEARAVLKIRALLPGTKVDRQ
jgi:hypothetical protein